jgi:hypothetical protein
LAAPAAERQHQAFGTRRGSGGTGLGAGCGRRASRGSGTGGGSGSFWPGARGRTFARSGRCGGDFLHDFGDRLDARDNRPGPSASRNSTPATAFSSPTLKVSPTLSSVTSTSNGLGQILRQAADAEQVGVHFQHAALGSSRRTTRRSAAHGHADYRIFSSAFTS